MLKINRFIFDKFLENYQLKSNCKFRSDGQKITDCPKYTVKSYVKKFRMCWY